MDTAAAAAATYTSLYGNEDGTVPATFQVIHLLGWKPASSQAKAARRGKCTIPWVCCLVALNCLLL
jgi:NADH dehydrogenase [ubiquinone] 1 alpha subcomplex assembly factor 5